MRLRIVGLLAAAVGVVLVTLLVPLLIVFDDLGELEATNTALARAGALAGQLASADAPAIPLDEVDGFPATVFLPDGRVLGMPVARSPEAVAAVAGRTPTATSTTGSEVLLPVPTTGGTAVVRVGVPRDPLHGNGIVALAVVALGIGVALISVAVADRLAQVEVSALADVAQAADRIAAGDTTARSTPAGPPEVRRLSSAVNKIAIQVEQLLGAERREGSDLAHRLRTPLTALELDVNALPESPAARNVVIDLNALTLAINGVISTSRRAVPRAPAGPVLLGDVVRERLRYWSALAAGTGRTAESAIHDEPCSVGVGRADLEAVVDALLANVFAHTPAGTGFRVAVCRRGAAALMIVEDRGPGFTRPDAVRRGRSGSGSTGLGLDIVRRTAESTGGSVRTGRSVLGGATVEVAFGAEVPLPARGSWLRRR